MTDYLDSPPCRFCLTDNNHATQGCEKLQAALDMADGRVIGLESKTHPLRMMAMRLVIAFRRQLKRKLSQ